MSNRVITINRMFGSNGRIIGKALAEELGFKFYDKELIEMASKEKNIPFDEFARVDERKASQWLYPVDYELQMNPEYHFVPMNDVLYAVNQRISNFWHSFHYTIFPQRSKPMKLLQILQKCLEDWKNISHLDFCLVNLDNTIYISTCDRALPSEEKLEEFKEDEVLCISNMNCRLYKVTESHQLQYVLIVWGNAEAASTIGELAVCQIESLLTAYMEKSDKNVFMQNLLLGSYSEVDAFNRAKKLHITTTVRRAVFLVETKQSKDENALATIRNIFAAKTRDFITAIDDSGIIILRELQPSEDYSDLDDIAHMLVDMLNTEAMTSAWVSYSNIADDLKQLPDAYKEARTALEVGKIFYTGKNVFGYNRLGIGRLIYQLPVEICEMFIDEFFKEETLDSIDDETLATIRTFFENNLNLSETSRQLYVHRNTLVYRFEKLQKKFGLDIRTFEDALTFKLAMMVVNYIKYKKAE